MVRHQMILAVVPLLGGCASQVDVSPTQPPAPVMQAILPSTPRTVLGSSVNGKPISIERLGAGPINVLIIAGIHGDESESVALANRLIADLRDHPDACAGRSVSIVAVANPDGYAANRRLNAKGVDLNRNFPATNYKSSRRNSALPADQPETIALIRAIDELRPKLIISIHSITSRRECNNYDGPAERIARVMNEHNGYRVTPTIGYPTPGSMGSYCGIDRGIAIITLEVPRGASNDSVWHTNRDALIAAIVETR